MYDELVKQLQDYAAGTMRDDDAEIAFDAINAIEKLEHKVFILEGDREGLLAQIPRWIPVSERLPEESGRYLVIAIEPWFGSTCTEIMRYRAGENLWAYDGRITESKITHWMLLPEPPKEET